MLNNSDETVIAVAGNPNVGKSTIFNALTGMKQHTGNWTGKTVSVAMGKIRKVKENYVLVDIPGTYSLFAHSAEEEVARDFICFGEKKATLIVCDATCLERNLNLVLQTIEATKNVVVCVNLMDEANRKSIKIDIDSLSDLLGVKVIGTVAKSKSTVKKVVDALNEVTAKDYKNSAFQVKYSEVVEKAIEILEITLEKKEIGKLPARWLGLRLLERNGDIIEKIKEYLGYDILTDTEVLSAFNDAQRHLAINGITKEMLSDIIVSAFVSTAEEIAGKAVTQKEGYNKRDLALDRIFTSKRYGYPVMLLLLGLIFWITIVGANYLSEILSLVFDVGEDWLNRFLIYISAPPWLISFIIEGIYRVPSWVIAVMLPPMSVFFPLFTLLEDSGYLPRVAYNLDKPFKMCNSCGKQALTTCMGFGCNAVGVMGCRIIDSKRERMLAILTNSFVPCNGRFPMILAVIGMFFVHFEGFYGNIESALILTAIIVLSILFTFIGTKILSLSLLKGYSSSYTLELPSYRKPEIGSVIVRSVLDRTVFVLFRSVSVAIPAGIIIWFMSNITVGDNSLLIVCSQFLDPFGRFIGLDGVILLAFILGFPANEIVIPIALMIYLSGDSLVELPSVAEMGEILISNGWTSTTAICTVIFSLLHWPCSTTVLTIKKETGSIKWALFSMLYPTALGIIICMLVSFVAKLF